jgi:hypothetical protein
MESPSDHKDIITETFEQYFKRQIEEGYIMGDGRPIKCGCGCVKFREVEKYYGDYLLEEYALECTNEACLRIVGRWSYGNWMV